jgi:hypothetical protein
MRFLQIAGPFYMQEKELVPCSNLKIIKLKIPIPLIADYTLLIILLSLYQKETPKETRPSLKNIDKM